MLQARPDHYADRPAVPQPAASPTCSPSHQPPVTLAPCNPIDRYAAGTSLRYKPGFIAGGGLGVEHDCGTSRAIGYFLEPLVLIALWGKKPLTCTLKGITNDNIDSGVDTWRTVTFPLLRTLTGAEHGFELKVGGWVRGCDMGVGVDGMGADWMLGWLV